MASPLSRSEFEYLLPPHQIAQAPCDPRDHSRLMVLNRGDQSLRHHSFFEIEKYLEPGDVLVLNSTRVFPARVKGRKATGGKVELLLLRPENEEQWWALVRGSSSVGAEIIFPKDMKARLVGEGENGEWKVAFSKPDVRSWLEAVGEMPLPPYIKRPEQILEDRDRYQTVYADREGSIAAPTAGFHFTAKLLDRLRQKKIQVETIVLHVGWGTFRPIRADRIADHTMLPEYYDVEPRTAERLTQARREGRRIIAVGTTAVRTLETIYDPTSSTFRFGRGATELFIYPGYQFRAIQALITNFHLAHSTPLLLACAFYSPEEAFSLRLPYEEAIRQGYRFYSYGDAMLIL